MAIQPSPRSDGSVHILRFVGNIVLAADPETRGNAELGTAPVALASASVTFTLADLTDTDDLTRQFPASVLDDTTPASAAPHDPNTPSGPVTGGGGVPSGMTWAQSLQVRVQETEDPHAALIARVDTLKPLAAYDPTTGLPQVNMEFYFTAAGVTAIGDDEQIGAGVPVIVEIEVPYTPIR